MIVEAACLQVEENLLEDALARLGWTDLLNSTLLKRMWLHAKPMMSPAFAACLEARQPLLGRFQLHGRRVLPAPHRHSPPGSVVHDARRERRGVARLIHPHRGRIPRVSSSEPLAPQPSRSTLANGRTPPERRREGRERQPRATRCQLNVRSGRRNQGGGFPCLHSHDRTSSAR